MFFLAQMTRWIDTPDAGVFFDWSDCLQKHQIIEFFIGYWQNGIAFMILAFLASPIGLPAIANLLLNLLDHLIGFLEGLVC